MAESIDVELLISLIEDRPVLWDKTLDTFKDRILTRIAWHEVCLQLNPDFDDIGDSARNAFVKEIMKRWANIRDAFARANKKIRESRKSGSGGKIPKKYVFNDQLQFLNKFYGIDYEEREESDEDVQHDTKRATELEISRKVMLSARKHRRPDEVELKILKALKAEKPSCKLSFFHSLLPHVEKYDENEMLEFQMGVLQVISDINQRKMLSCQPQQLPSCSPQPAERSKNKSATHL